MARRYHPQVRRGVPRTHFVRLFPAKVGLSVGRNVDGRGSSVIREPVADSSECHTNNMADDDWASGGELAVCLRGGAVTVRPSAEWEERDGEGWALSGRGATTGGRESLVVERKRARRTSFYHRCNIAVSWLWTSCMYVFYRRHSLVKLLSFYKKSTEFQQLPPTKWKTL